MLRKTNMYDHEIVQYQAQKGRLLRVVARSAFIQVSAIKVANHDLTEHCWRLEKADGDTTSYCTIMSEDEVLYIEEYEDRNNVKEN